MKTTVLDTNGNQLDLGRLLHSLLALFRLPFDAPSSGLSFADYEAMERKMSAWKTYLQPNYQLRLSECWHPPRTRATKTLCKSSGKGFNSPPLCPHQPI